MTTEWEARTGSETENVQGCAEGDWSWRVDQLAEAVAGLTVTRTGGPSGFEPRSHEIKDTSCHCSPCLLKENVTEES